MTKPCFCLSSLSAVLILAYPASPQVERIWLTHRTNDPSKLVVNWTTKTPGDSKVKFGPTMDYGQEVKAPGNTTLHHVEIPLPKNGEVYYSVSTGDQTSTDSFFKTTRPTFFESPSSPTGRASRTSRR